MFPWLKNSLSLVDDSHCLWMFPFWPTLQQPLLPLPFCMKVLGYLPPLLELVISGPMD